MQELWWNLDIPIYFSRTVKDIYYKMVEETGNLMAEQLHQIAKQTKIIIINCFQLVKGLTQCQSLKRLKENHYDGNCRNLPEASSTSRTLLTSTLITIDSTFYDQGQENLSRSLQSLKTNAACSEPPRRPRPQDRRTETSLGEGPSHLYRWLLVLALAAPTRKRCCLWRYNSSPIILLCGTRHILVLQSSLLIPPQESCGLSSPHFFRLDAKNRLEFRKQRGTTPQSLPCLLLNYHLVVSKLRLTFIESILLKHLILNLRVQVCVPNLHQHPSLFVGLFFRLRHLGTWRWTASSEQRLYPLDRVFPS
uniref:Uncharacterized protein n=1 Tax=Timema cristinae TaxID=61476 RepID=A0A7R9H0F2_TIMCR|nr:unnamed protein product [Timema cristinae]